MTTPQQPQSFSQHALQSMETSASNMRTAIEQMGQDATSDDYLAIAGIQAQLAMATALLDLASATREAPRGVYAGLERVAGAITSAVPPKGPGGPVKPL